MVANWFHFKQFYRVIVLSPYFVVLNKIIDCCFLYLCLHSSILFLLFNLLWLKLVYKIHLFWLVLNFLLTWKHFLCIYTIGSVSYIHNCVQISIKNSNTLTREDVASSVPRLKTELNRQSFILRIIVWVKWITAFYPNLIAVK